eukprot:15353906-Ditylum_brightwellii.AAC.1
MKEAGKWFLIYQKNQYHQVVELIDIVLPELFKQIKAKYKIKGYNYPARQRPKGARTQSLYAEALKGYASSGNPQEEEENRYNKPPPPRERKCRAFAMTTEEFLDLPSIEAVGQAEKITWNTKVATAQEINKSKEETKQRLKEVKKTVKADMEALRSEIEESKSNTQPSTEINIEEMKKEITATLKREMSTMIEMATKTAVDSVKNNLNKHMEGRFTSLEDKFITLVGTVKTKI